MRTIGKVHTFTTGYPSTWCRPETVTKSDVKNYRPICSLSPFSKIFEKIIYNRMIEFIDQNNILSPNQFGFRKDLVPNQQLYNLLIMFTKV